MSHPRHPSGLEASSRRSLSSLPKARIEKNWKTRLILLVPLAAAVLAGYFIYSEVFSGGPTIHIYFQDAEGLQAGQTQVKYRGIQIGTVKEAELIKNGQMVDVTVSLIGSADKIAREGSRFWIVKPEVGIEQIRGLRTMVSGNFITVEPGNGKPQDKFTALSEPPLVEPPGALQIVLLSEKLASIKKQTPVFYRGVQVGEVFAAELGPESQTIRITVDIYKHYATLVRMNSKFWNAGGINFSLGLSGAEISAQSAQALISGGIAFGTPDTTQKEAYAGTTFRLYDKPQDDWLAWAPPIPLPGQAPPEKKPVQASP